ncbi:YqaJ viral recombinase family protein [Mycobacterium sp. SVM_VP21]|nr:YqaJ viral recombinase family protein [Mycobacterium sp. SVM_VP21]
MNIEPGSPEWLQLITPSKVAAILGVSRFESPFRLWHRMKGNLPPEPPKDIFAVGHDFEPALAAIWRRKNPGWLLSPGEVQVSSAALPFPNVATLDRRAVRGSLRRVVEFKTARRMEDWGDEFTDQAPADYAAQVTFQMIVTGFIRHPAHLLVMGPYFNDHLYEIPFDVEIAEAIVNRCNRFYQSLQSDTPPALDDSVATYEAVRQLHPDINDGEIAEIPPVLACQVLDWHREQTHADKSLRGFKTQLLDAMGNAQIAECGGITVAKRTPAARGAVALRIEAKNHEALHDANRGAW